MTDPELHERVYYKHMTNGQRAYVVQRAGQERLRYDLGPHEEIIVPLEPKEWALDRDHRPFNPTHLARVAYMADREVCAALSMHREVRKEFRDLDDRERLRFIKEGPGRNAHPARIRVYEYIRAALEPFTA